MAPPSDAAKALQGNRARPATRGIVPAIPLPYMQKRKQTVAAPKKVEQKSAPAVAPTPAPVAEIPEDSPKPAANISPTDVNGSNSTPSTSVKELELSVVDTIPAVEGEAEDRATEVEEAPAPAPAPLEEQAAQAPTPPIASSDNQSSGTRSTYNMPPPFVPANPSYANAHNEHVKFPRQPSFSGQHSMHQAHPSTGSLVFGGYPESNNSSPAPPLSAGGMPQFPQQGPGDTVRGQGQPYANGSHVHMHTYSNSYVPPLGPDFAYRQDVHLITNHEYSRRQMMSFSPSDGHPHSAGHSGPEGQRYPARESFNHIAGSQSSAPNEDNSPGFYNEHRYPTAVITNGSNGHVEDVRLYHQPRAKVRTASQTAPINHNGYIQPNMSQPPMQPAMDNLDGLLPYLQSQFADARFADYTLELRYADDRAEPVRIPGHNLLFARSPTLKNLMTAQAQESSSDPTTLRTLFIQSDDRFLRSDGFWLAVQRLYGGPLLDPGASATAHGASQLSSSTPGAPADRFDLALGYAAAGHILQIPPVVNRGIDIASHFVNWLTLEKALDFALDGGFDAVADGSQAGASPNTYGPAVTMLIDSALTFMITAFPPNFELDTTVPEPTHNRRLLHVPTPRPSMPNPRLSSIKFGDHLSEEPVRPSSTNSTTANLSKILINLPFQLLKYVLESSRLGNVEDWATTRLRQKVMHAVVEEREKRRIKVRDSAVPSAERIANKKDWETVGWREFLAAPAAGAGPDVLELTRTWDDFVAQTST